MLIIKQPELELSERGVCLRERETHIDREREGGRERERERERKINIYKEFVCNQN